MQYRTKRRTGIRWWILGILLIVALAAIFFLRPIWVRMFSFEAPITTGAFASRRALRTNIEELSQRTLYTTALEAQIVALQKENQLLRDVLPEGMTGMRARVVGRVDRTLFDRVFIDIGSNAGVTPGMMVHAGTAVVGKVLEVYPSRSLISYTSDPKQETDAVLISASVPIKIVGQGGGSVEFELPRDVVVAAGDVVSFAADPSALVAIVESFSSDDRNPVRRVEARVPVNIHQLRYVFIK